MNNQVNMDILGNIIPEGTQGIVYLCEYNRDKETLKVHRAIYFNNPSTALEVYSNIPNPESQVAIRTKLKSFEEELRELHQTMEDPKWLSELKEYL